VIDDISVNCLLSMISFVTYDMQTHPHVGVDMCTYKPLLPKIKKKSKSTGKGIIVSHNSS